MIATCSLFSGSASHGRCEQRAYLLFHEAPDHLIRLFPVFKHDERDTYPKRSDDLLVFRLPRIRYHLVERFLRSCTKQHQTHRIARRLARRRIVLEQGRPYGLVSVCNCERT